jgi:hypothetical protein
MDEPVARGGRDESGTQGVVTGERDFTFLT